MDPERPVGDPPAAGSAATAPRRGVTVVSPEAERRIYFLATLALAAWYLLDLVV